MIQPRLFTLFCFFMLITAVIFFVQFRSYRTIEIVSLNNTDARVSAVMQKDAISAINEPIFESVQEADVYLENEGLGIVVELAGSARFYPYQILVWHEVVNDTFADRKLLITFSPLTFMGAVYDRSLNDEALSFRTSGQLWNSHPLLYDSVSESSWSQMKGEAIEGSFTEQKLERIPSFITTWTTFKKNYPYGKVLSRHTGVDRDYTQDPYEQKGYYTSADIWFPLSHKDDRLPVKTLIVGFEENGFSYAYPLEKIQKQGSISANIHNREIKIIWDDELRAVRAFDEKQPFALVQTYWFAWAASYPQTELY